MVESAGKHLKEYIPHCAFLIQNVKSFARTVYQPETFSHTSAGAVLGSLLSRNGSSSSSTGGKVVFA